MTTGVTTGDDGGIRLDVAPPDGDSGGAGPQGCSFIDVLFVVDISASMREERTNLQANAEGLARVLDEYVADPSRNAVGYRIGATNSTIVDNGPDQQSTLGLDGRLFGGGSIGCWETFSPPWIEGPGPDVAENLSCLVNSPTAGSGSDVGKERPLDALEYFIAEHGPGGANEGFYRREDALFVVVNLTDEDDDPEFTTTTPEQAAAQLEAFVDGPNRAVVVTIAGPEADRCDSAFGSASPAPVLHAFTNGMPNGMLGDICQGDLAQPLADALELIQISCDVLPPPG